MYHLPTTSWATAQFFGLFGTLNQRAFSEVPRTTCPKLLFSAKFLVDLKTSENLFFLSCSVRKWLLFRRPSLSISISRCCAIIPKSIEVIWLGFRGSRGFGPAFVDVVARRLCQPHALGTEIEREQLTGGDATDSSLTIHRQNAPGLCPHQSI